MQVVVFVLVGVGYVVNTIESSQVGSCLCIGRGRICSLYNRGELGKQLSQYWQVGVRCVVGYNGSQLGRQLVILILVGKGRLCRLLGGNVVFQVLVNKGMQLEGSWVGRQVVCYVKLPARWQKVRQVGRLIVIWLDSCLGICRQVFYQLLGSCPQGGQERR